MPRGNYLKTFLISIVIASYIAACNPMINYSDSDNPAFQGNYATADPEYNGQIKVISYNIRFSQGVPAAIDELKQKEDLKDFDILLLQEMDEHSVEQIAQELHLNFIYYPASIHSYHRKNFGNAILTRWSLSDPKKIILPHQNPRTRQIRIAVSAMINIAGTPVQTYSIHTETPWLSSKKRLEQVQTAANSADINQQYTIIGGDFNTFTQKSLEELDKRMSGFGFERVSAGASPTIEVGPLKFTLDHIYTKGFVPASAGRSTPTTASDHYAIWTVLRFN